MPIDLRQALRNRAWQPPTPDQEALQDPLIAPETYGAGSVLRKAMTGLAGGGAMLGQTVYHGSPHLFDKFDINKVGAGQGAQTYGHGLYMAENPAVAQTYAETLGLKNLQHTAAEHARYSDSPDDTVENLFGEFKDGPPRRLLEALRKDDWLGHDFPHGALDELARASATGRMYNSPSQETIDALGGLQNIYKVDLPDSAIKRMLNWDTPVSAQLDVARRLTRPPGIGRFAPRDIRDALGVMGWSDVSGGQAYRGLAYSLFKKEHPGQHMTTARQGDQQASEMLNRVADIPGIKYADQGSRGTLGGTSNYVVFDDSLPRIIERSNLKSKLRAHE